jgi:hypothetical protein
VFLKTDAVCLPPEKGKPSPRVYVIRKISFKGTFGLAFIFPEDEKTKILKHSCLRNTKATGKVQVTAVNLYVL